MPDLRAFRVSHARGSCLVVATSETRARHIARMGARDAGYDLSYRDLQRVLRAPEYDGLRFHPAHHATKCWRPDHADRALTELEPLEA